MQILMAGIFIFLGIHLVPTSGQLRRSLITRLGEGPYKGIFSLISLTSLILIIYGMAHTPFIAVWTPPVWGRWAALALMPISLTLIAATYLPNNLKRYTPHPMLWGVMAWATAHLLANGDLAAVLLFGSFGLFSVIDIVSANNRGAALSRTTHPWSMDALTVVTGIAVFAVVLSFHSRLFGVSVFT